MKRTRLLASLLSRVLSPAIPRFELAATSLLLDLPELVRLCTIVSLCHHTSLANFETGFNNVGLYVRRQKNVIIRNLKISYVVAANGDAITVDVSDDACYRTVWSSPSATCLQLIGKHQCLGWPQWALFSSCRRQGLLWRPSGCHSWIGLRDPLQVSLSWPRLEQYVGLNLTDLNLATIFMTTISKCCSFRASLVTNPPQHPWLKPVLHGEKY